MKHAREQVAKIISQKKWNIQGFNGYPLYIHCAGTASGWLNEPRFKNYSHFFFMFSKSRAYMYYDEQDWQRIGEDYYEKVKAIDELLRLERESYQVYQEAVQESLYSEEDFEDMQAESLVVLVGNLCQRIIKAVNFGHAIEGITYVSERKLREILSEKGKFSETEFSKLCSPVYPSFLALATEKLWNIKNCAGDHQEKEIKSFIEEYSWIENSYLGATTFTPEMIKQKSNELNKEPSTAVISKDEKNDIMDKYGFSEEERFMVETVEICFRWQDERKKHIFQSIEALDPVLKKLAEALNIDLKDLLYCLPAEIALQKLSDKDFQDELHKRRGGSAHYAEPESIEIFVNEDFDFFAEQLKVSFDFEIKEINGTVASGGTVEGIVRVCESVSDIPKVQSGEILVASMTRPEYLPAMHQAAAFVTNEGGVTSHAAIVSRELNKPCIIGTKIATHVLKDGDLVEVNANEGIVKVLKRATDN